MAPGESTLQSTRIQWYGEFAVPEVENAFQNSHWKTTAARLRFISIITAFAYLAAFWGDYMRLGAVMEFYVLLGARITCFLLGLSCAVAAMARKHLPGVYILLAAYLCAIGLTESLELLMSPEAMRNQGASFTAVIFLTFYLFLPPRLFPTLTVTPLLSSIYVATHALGVHSNPEYVWITILFMGLVNLFGTYFVITFGKAQRSEYRALEEERQLNRRLQEEIILRRKVEERLRDLATSDGLTGLANRRYFLETFHRELDRALRYGRELSLLMVDIDHFKRVNDNYGHPVGDEALRGLGRVLLSSLRDNDFAGRLGGEEFAVLLPETGREAAQEVARRLWKTMSQTPLATSAGPMVLTVSVGVAEAGAERQDPGALLRAADEALYQAKRGGRNQVQSAPEASSTLFAD